MHTDPDQHDERGQFTRIYTGTTTEKELRLLAAQGLSSRQIAETLNISFGMLQRCLTVLGIKTARQPRRYFVGTPPAWQKVAKADKASANNPFGL